MRKFLLLTKTVFSVLILAIVFSQPIFSQSQGFPYHLYEPRTLAELSKLNSGFEKVPVTDSVNLMVADEPYYSAVRVKYAGEKRELSTKKLAFYKYWAAALEVGSTNTDYNPLDVIKTEYLFTQCDKEYWITVQTPAANDLPPDLKSGDRLTLYLMINGGIETNGNWDYLYLANSFKIY
ncbi:MAG: hypothetical protein ACK5NT_02955 [Pyrinomonadaceae bacterium]